MAAQRSTPRLSSPTTALPVLLLAVLVGCGPPYLLPSAPAGPAPRYVPRAPAPAPPAPAPAYVPEAPLPAPPAPPARPPVVVVQPAPPPAPRPAALEVHNATARRIEVQRDGASLGGVDAGRSRTFRGLTPGLALLVASDREGRVVGEERRALRSAAVVRWTVASPACTLEVVNLTRRHYSVQVAGRRWTVVAPRSSLRLKELPPGSLLVKARPRKGPAPEQRAALGCTPGAALRWEILPPPPPAPPRRARLLVVNRHEVPLVLRVAGRGEGEVAPRGERELRGLAPGPLAVEVVAPAGQRVRGSLRLVPGERARWEPRLPAEGTLEVHNSGPRPVEVLRGGRRLGRVAPGARRVFEGLRAGAKPLRAVTPGGREVGAQRLPLPAGAVVRWDVRFAELRGRVVVHNGSGRRVEVLRDGASLGRLDDGAEAAFEVPRGSARFEARGVGRRRRVIAQRELQVRRGPVRWEIPPLLEELSVTNRTTEGLQLHVDGRAEGRLRRGKTWSRALGPGRHEVVGKGRETGEEYRLQVRLRAGEPAKLVFEGRKGALTVINTGTQALRVKLDGRVLGEVPARAERTWSGLDVGRRTLRCVGLLDRRHDERQVVIGSGGARVRVGLSPARVRPRPAGRRPLDKVVPPARRR